MDNCYQHAKWVSLSHSKRQLPAAEHVAPKAVIVFALSLWLTLCGTAHAQAPVFSDGFETCHVSLSPESINFGDVVQGSTGPAKALKIGNDGNEAFNITGLAGAPGTSSQFKISSAPALPANVDTAGSVSGAMLVQNDTFACPESGQFLSVGACWLAQVIRVVM